MMEHVGMITGWEKFEGFFATVRALDVRAYGSLSSEAETWARQFGVVGKTFGEHLAGFVR